MLKFIDEDFVAVRRNKNDKKAALTLAFGEAVEVLGGDGNFTRVRVPRRWDGTFEGFIKGSNPPLRDSGVLAFSTVDVQQGDGMIVETPGGRIVFIDGGDNKLFARHAAARFRHRNSSDASPLEVDAIVVTHGDADHFDGLNDLRRCETLPASKARKRLFIHPKRVYHNGLVKSPSRRSGSTWPELERFGRTVDVSGTHHVVDLYDDPRDAPEAECGEPFKRWRTTLDHWESRGPIDVRRLEFGMDESSLFDFLAADGVTVELQGPFTDEIVDPQSGNTVKSLPYLDAPKKTPELHLVDSSTESGSPSASHTINGHSLSMRLTFGNVRFQLTGDLNRDAMQRIRSHVAAAELEAEIVKAPHHGSHDFDFQALKNMSPVVAIVSSGDEDTFHEHIHPRATLMSALGKVMRKDTGIIFVTELAAFFHKRDYCHKREDLAEYFKGRKDETFTGEDIRQLFTGIPRDEDPKNLFYGFERTNFGIVHIRTDGERVLAFTHSGKKGTNEAYRFKVDDQHKVTFEPVITR
jgi:beta-lactamase superfamily II metal-dependent hydrolase